MPEDYRGYTIVALAHHHVAKPRNLIDNRLLRDLQDVPEEIRITPEVPDRGHTAPADRIAGLAPAERAPAGVRDDRADIFFADLKDPRPQLIGGLHGFRGKKDHHAV